MFECQPAVGELNSYHKKCVLGLAGLLFDVGLRSIPCLWLSTGDYVVISKTDASSL